MDDVSYVFSVKGKPIPKGSTRSFAIKKGGRYTGKTATIQNNAETLYAWQARIAEAARAAKTELYDGPWAIYQCVFAFDRPKSHYRTGKNAHLLKDSAPLFPIGRNLGDIDKLLRAVLDGLEGVAWANDSQVVLLERPQKVWVGQESWACEQGVRLCIGPITKVVSW